jgi:hypothetical protein
LVEKISSGLLKADAQNAVVTANVVRHCVWLLQRLQVADLAPALVSNLISGWPRLSVMFAVCFFFGVPTNVGSR